MNSLHLYRCDLLDTLSIEECGAYIEKHYPKVSLSAVNWPSVAPYQPLCIVTGAYSEKYIYIHFVSREYGLRAVNTENLSPIVVWSFSFALLPAKSIGILNSIALAL